MIASLLMNFFHAQITWLLDGEEVEDAEVKYSDNGEAEFFLREVLLEDGGIYSCIAENSLKKVTSSCRVTIKSEKSHSL